ncbi:MAG: BatA domain-containing protein [Planctomycetales bacterium]|nr:BatA domain-containing protein [Planctomycetales bacterium]
MSFLTPLYLAGLLAVGLPVFFHLIRREPTGKTPFSTLMFLSPSPPKLAKRKRIENWPLLMLRIAALAALALAFARPFVPQGTAFTAATPPPLRVALVVDVSASMRRDVVWERAQEALIEEIDRLGGGDEVALFAFDSATRTVVDWPVDEGSSDAHRLAVREAVEALSPDWGSTNLGDSLVEAAESLVARPRPEQGVGYRQRVVLVSDMQRGSRLEALQDYAWPMDVELQVRRVESKTPGNASLRLVVDEQSMLDEDPSFRALLAVTPDALGFPLQGGWLADDGAPLEPTFTRDMESGAVRAVPLEAPQPVGSPGFYLRGDDCDFDNVYYQAPRREQRLGLVYCGPEEEQDAAGDATARFFATRAFPATAHRTVEWLNPSAAATWDDPDLKLAIVVASLPNSEAERIAQALRRGVNVLCVATSADMSSTVARLSGDLSFRVEPLEVDDYLLWANVDREDPLLSPFADPRYGDFSKVRFWKASTFEVGDDGWRTLARYDRGDVAFLARNVERGRLFAIGASWGQQESQLALSTKFVPLLGQMTQRVAEVATERYETGDRLPLLHGGRVLTRVTDPAGEVTVVAAESPSYLLARPGVYRLEASELAWDVAVNLPASESDTTPLPDAALGFVQDTQRRRAAEASKRLAELPDVELEQRQSLWQWIVAATLVGVVVETWLAGRQATAVSVETAS